MILFVCCLAPLAIPDSKPLNIRQAALSQAEERALRNAVYEGAPVTAFPSSGKWALYEILVAPNSVMSLQGAKSKAGLTILLDIVKGGRTSDAVMATGYALCLAGNPVEGCFVMTFDKTNIDLPIKGQGITRRQQLVQRVQELIDAVGK
jgi:hypothetical protein